MSKYESFLKLGPIYINLFYLYVYFIITSSTGMGNELHETENQTFDLTLDHLFRGIDPDGAWTKFGLKTVAKFFESILFVGY